MHTHLFIESFEHCNNCHRGSKGCMHVLYSNGKHKNVTVRLNRASESFAIGTAADRLPFSDDLSPINP